MYVASQMRRYVSRAFDQRAITENTTKQKSFSHNRQALACKTYDDIGRKTSVWGRRSSQNAGKQGHVMAPGGDALLPRQVSTV